MLVIIMNAIALASRDCKDNDNTTSRNRTVDLISHISTALYALEALVKMLALGVWRHKTSYFRNGWNWIDFFFVTTG
jgi:hypothetical protein